jgi:outer membrane protein TolC
MKKICLLLTAMAVMALPAAAQDAVERILTEVEAHNPTLGALREAVKAQKLANRTGIAPENPAVALNYLWGTPGSIGNRTDVSVSQTVDMATLLGIKAKIADAQDSRDEWQYRAGRMAILLEAKQLCIDLIYFNALHGEVAVRLEHAGALADAYDRRLERGDVSRLEYNKAQLNLVTAGGESERVRMARNELLAELRRLNGGHEVALDADRFDDTAFPADFDEWFLRAALQNPALAAIRQEVEISRRRVGLSRAMGMPALTGGYMSEKVGGEHFQGITVGVTIPLWENRNRVRHARAAARAAEMQHSDATQQLYHHLKMRYQRAAELKGLAVAYRRALDMLNSAPLLRRALEAGEISILDYIVESQLLYDTVVKALEAERDFRKACAELDAAGM